jgi:radical SAM superfamily enzyme YgiQ (UPF0313 family)/precorrin-3B methylase
MTADTRDSRGGFFAMRALLIDPGRRYLERDRAIAKPYPHNGLAYLATVLAREGLGVSVIDAALEGLDEQAAAQRAVALRPDVVLITAMTFNAGAAFHTAALVREQDPPPLIVLGGVHPTLLPRRTLEECPAADVVVAGEGEEAVVEIARALDGGGVAALAGRPGMHLRGHPEPPPPRPIADLDRLPFPDWGLFDYERYLAIPSRWGAIHLYHLNSSRGCPYSCTFCSPVHGGRVRLRSPESIVEEMAVNLARRGARHFDLADSNATLVRPRFMRLCRLLLDRGLAGNVSWNIDTGPHLVDAEMVQLARAAGCGMVSFGLESGDDEMLKRMRKPHSVAEAEQGVRAAVEGGLTVKVSFILGHPGETPASAERTFAFASHLRRTYGVEYYYNLVDAYPETELWRMVERGEAGARWVEGTRGNWDAYGRTRSMIELPGLPAGEFERLYAHYTRALDEVSGSSFYEGKPGRPGRVGTPEVVIIGVGFAPGHVTAEAASELGSCRAVMGHERVLRTVAAHLPPGVEVLADAESRERAADLAALRADRLARTMDAARRVGKVAYVCSGDAGVYSYAEPVLRAAHAAGVRARVVPGITAATAVAARLGAPLRDAFAVIGLYDQHLPEALAAARVEAAAAADMVIVIYLPVHEAVAFPELYPPERYPEAHPIAERSRARLLSAISCLRRHRGPQTPIGVVTLDGEDVVTTLAEFERVVLPRVHPYSTLIVGNSRTRLLGRVMVTPGRDEDE